jgi:hypothetical protein
MDQYGQRLAAGPSGILIYHPPVRLSHDVHGSLHDHQLRRLPLLGLVAGAIMKERTAERIAVAA